MNLEKEGVSSASRDTHYIELPSLITPTRAGIYGPGYRARRAERIKEAYGIDVPV